MSKPSDERYTPKPAVKVIQEMFEGVSWLDPCTADHNPTGAPLYCTKHGSFVYGGGRLLDVCGRKLQWSAAAKHAYVNEPYSHGQILWWTRKILEEVERGVEVVNLIPSDLGTKGGKLVATTATALCFVSGRLAFSSPDGAADTGAKQPSIVPYWGERSGRFERIFSQLGTVWVR